MSRGKVTRSKTRSVLEESNMPDTVETNDDIQSLLALMTKTLSAVTQQTANGSNKNHPKLEDCPIKRKTSSLEAWLGEISLWNESNAGEYDGLNAKKYLKFVDSVRKSEESSDLKNLVEVAFVEN